MGNFVNRNQNDSVATESNENYFICEKTPFGLHKDIVRLILNESTSIELQFDGICKCIPAIYQFKSKDKSVGLQWEPSIDPQEIPNHFLWQSGEQPPEILRQTCGPTISYEIWVGDQLIQKGVNRPVHFMKNGPYPNGKNVGLNIIKGMYCVDDIQFKYDNDQLIFIYYTFVERE